MWIARAASARRHERALLKNRPGGAISGKRAAILQIPGACHADGGQGDRTMKKLSFIRRNDQRHWVGDGFPVRSIFSYNDLGKEISPFLLLDYAGPENFPPSEQRRGVGVHPHRGFETVTIVYSGEVEHR